MNKEETRKIPIGRIIDDYKEAAESARDYGEEKFAKDYEEVANQLEKLISFYEDDVFVASDYLDEED